MAPPKVKPTFNEGAPAVALGAFGDVSQSTTPAVVARAPTTKIAAGAFPVPIAELLVLKPVVLVPVVPEQPGAPSYEDLATKPTTIPTPIAATPAPPVIHPASRCVSPALGRLVEPALRRGLPCSLALRGSARSGRCRTPDYNRDTPVPLSFAKYEASVHESPSTLKAECVRSRVERHGGHAGRCGCTIRR